MKAIAEHADLAAREVRLALMLLKDRDFAREHRGGLWEPVQRADGSAAPAEDVAAALERELASSARARQGGARISGDNSVRRWR